MYTTQKCIPSLKGYINGFVPQPPLTEPEIYSKQLLRIGFERKDNLLYFEK